MGPKILIRLLIALAVIGGIAAALHFKGSGGVSEVTSSTSKKKVFADFPINDVAAIEIRAKDASLTLSKGETAWEVKERDGYTANTEPIFSLLVELWDLNIAQPVTIGRAQFGRLSLVAPDEATSEEEAATILTFRDVEGKDLASLWLGKVYERSTNRPNPFGGGMATAEAGRYIKPGSSNSVYLVGNIFEAVETDPSKWIDKSFFQVDKIKTIEFKSEEKSNNWKLVREKADGDFTLVGAGKEEVLDQAKVSSMRGAFGNAQLEDVITGESIAEYPTGKTSFAISTFEGFSYRISLGEKSDLNELSLSLKVSAELQKERKAGEDESEEDKDRLDKAFDAELNTQKAKLKKEKALEGHLFKVRSYLVDSISKPRAELMVSEEAPAEGTEIAPGITLPPGFQGLQPGGPGN